MTHEEAITVLKHFDGYFIGHSSDEVYTALDMAISALDLISHIKNRPCQACDHNKGNGCTRWECAFDSHLCRKEKG